MTQEEKYKEALLEARAVLEPCLKYSNGKVREALDSIDNELKRFESEDERIRKELKEAFEAYDIESKWNGIPIRSIFAWLEKQKEASKALEAVDRIDKYIDDHLANAHDMKDSNPDKKYYRGWDDALGKMAGILQDVYSEKQKENSKSCDSIPSNCASDVKCEDRWHKVGDSLPDNGREVLAKDKLGNTLLARYDGEGWDVSVYDDEDYRCHNGISKWCEIPSEKQKEQDKCPEFCVRSHCIGCSIYEKQKEQKPVDYDHEMWKNCEANFEGGKKEVIEHPEKYGLQKPDTRDADDLQLLGFIYDLLNEIDWKDNWAMSKDECLRRLNNYHPNNIGSKNLSERFNLHWKPSEEQMEALDKAIPVCMGVVGRDAVAPFESLCEQLEKLM